MRLKHLFSKHSINYLLSSCRFINGRASSFHTTKLSGTTDCMFSNTYDGIGATLSKHSTLHLLCPSSSHLVFSNNTRTIHSYESETTTSRFDDGKKPSEAYGSSDNVTNELVVESTCAISNEFSSRFCWVMRGKMFEVYKQWHEKIIYDYMLHILVIVMSEVESKYFDRIIIGSVMVTPSPDIYADCWRMLTELCNAGIVDFSLSGAGGNYVMMRFASAVSMEGDIIREVKWEFDCREFPQSKFYSELENIRGNDQTRKATKTDYVDGEEGGHVSLPMIDGYIKAGKLERAKETLESFLSRKFIPDIQMTENIYMVLLRSFARRGDAEGANGISRAMESAGFQPTLETCTLLIEAYGKAGEVDLARKHFDRISELGYKPDRSSIFKMLLAYQKCVGEYYNESRALLKQFPVYY